MKAWWTQGNAPDVYPNLWKYEGAGGGGSTIRYFGAINPAGTVQVDGGSSQSFTFTPETGYVVDSYVVDGQGYSAAPGHAFTKVQASHAIEVKFKADIGQPVTYVIDASAGSGGSVSPAGAITVNQGAGQSFSITPVSCYRIAYVTVNGASVGTPATYAFSNVQANHTIAAAFESTGGGTCTNVSDG